MTQYSFHPLHPDDEQWVIGTKSSSSRPRKITLADKIQRRAVKRLTKKLKNITIESILIDGDYHKIASASVGTPYGELIIEAWVGGFGSLPNPKAFIKWGIESRDILHLDYVEEWDWSLLFFDEIQKINPEIAKILEETNDEFVPKDSRHRTGHARLSRKISKIFAEDRYV